MIGPGRAEWNWVRPSCLPRFDNDRWSKVGGGGSCVLDGLDRVSIEMGTCPVGSRLLLLLADCLPNKNRSSSDVRLSRLSAVSRSSS